MNNEKCKECDGCKGKPAHSAAKWRSDFPVQWENDNYITRREMVKFLALGSAFLAGGNVLLAALPHDQVQSFPRQRIASLDDLSDKATVLFRYPSEHDPCMLVRTRAGKLAAYSAVCTHLSCAVIHNEQENTLFCPCHNGYFTVADGRPYAGPPTRPLPRIQLEQQGNQIFAVGVQI